jgi:hypothetical protein
MKKVPFAIFATTLYLVVFHIAPIIGIPVWIIVTMFMLSPVVLITMVYVVLKYGKPSSFTFEERFYDDWDYRRNIPEKNEQQM